MGGLRNPHGEYWSEGYVIVTRNSPADDYYMERNYSYTVRQFNHSFNAIFFLKFHSRSSLERIHCMVCPRLYPWLQRL